MCNKAMGTVIKTWSGGILCQCPSFLFTDRSEVNIGIVQVKQMAGFSKFTKMKWNAG